MTPGAAAAAGSGQSSATPQRRATYKPKPLPEVREGLDASAFRHLDQIDELGFVLSFEPSSGLLDEDEVLACALTCVAFYQSVCKCFPVIDAPRHSLDGKRFRTRRRAVVRSISLLRWGTAQCKLPLSTRLCKSAASIGNVAVLEHAREMGCEWDVTTCHAAAAAGHDNLLVWAYEHNAPIDAKCATFALWRDAGPMFTWLTGYGLRSGTVSLCLQGCSVMSNKVHWHPQYRVVVSFSADFPGRQSCFVDMNFASQFEFLKQIVADEVELDTDDLLFTFQTEDGFVRTVADDDTAATLRIDTQRPVGDDVLLRVTLDVSLSSEDEDEELADDDSDDDDDDTDDDDDDGDDDEEDEDHAPQIMMAPMAAPHHMGTVPMGAPQMGMALMTAPQIHMGHMTAPQIAMGPMTAQIAMGPMAAPQIAMGPMTAPQIAMGPMAATQIAMGPMTAHQIFVAPMTPHVAIAPMTAPQMAMTPQMGAASGTAPGAF